MSGTGSSREFVQRLGRLLRKSEGKGQARLIELVSNETSETRTSSRRKRSGKHDGEKEEGREEERPRGAPEQVNDSDSYDDGEEAVVE
jgi:superfamily II DNA or RNA helicase